MWHKILFLTSALTLVACSSSFLDKGRAFHTQPVTWSQVPGWKTDNLTEALPAILNSCTKAPSKMVHFCQGLNSHINDDADGLRSYFEESLWGESYEYLLERIEKSKITTKELYEKIYKNQL